MTKLVFGALWLAQPVALALMVAVMFRRRLHRRFPIFFSYAILLTLSMSAHFVASFVSYEAYFYVYWTTEALLTILAFGVIYEIFNSIFRQHEGLQDFGTVLFRWAGVVMSSMALLLLLSSGSGKTARIVQVVLAADRSVGVMECGLLLFVLLFTKHLRINFRSPVFGITLGVGLSASVQFILLAQWVKFQFSATALNMIHMSAGVVACAIWLAYMMAPLPAEQPVNVALKPLRWSDALRHAAAPADAQSPVLSGIENVVDRAFSRRANGMNGVNGHSVSVQTKAST